MKIYTLQNTLSHIIVVCNVKYSVLFILLEQQQTARSTSQIELLYFAGIQVTCDTNLTRIIVTLYIVYIMCINISKVLNKQHLRGHSVYYLEHMN